MFFTCKQCGNLLFGTCKVCVDVTNVNTDQKIVVLNETLNATQPKTREEVATTDELVCSNKNCLSKNIQMKTFMNRSEDEGVTTRFYCLDCGTRYSEN